MQHYNLYKTLQLDPSATSTQLVDELTQRLADGNTSNPGGEEEIRLAQEIFGSPTKREMYDSRLKSDSGAPMNAQSLRSLAAMPAPQGAQQPQPSPAPEGQSTKLEASTEPEGDGIQHEQDASGSTIANSSSPSASSNEASTASPETSRRDGFAFSADKFKNAPEMKRFLPIGIGVAAVLVLALVIANIGGSKLGSSGPEQLANEIAQLEKKQRADWLNEHAAEGRAETLEKKLDDTNIGAFNDLENTAGESYDLKDLVSDRSDGAEQTEYLDRLYSLGGIDEVRLVGIDSEVKNKDVHVKSLNSQLLLFARKDGDWKLYDITDK